MNANRLLAHYEQIADAPDAIQRLRRFVLDLAVRGKLVPQDPNDEPPGKLSEKFAKSNRTQSELPQCWIHAKVGTLFDFKYGKALPASARAERGSVPVYGSNGIVGYTEEPLTNIPTIVIGRKGSAGALNLSFGPSWTTDVAYYVTAPSIFDIRFLRTALEVLDLGKLGKGVKPGLSRRDAYDLSLSVPPLAEQRRIVAKVDELMALCDQLEGARAEREMTRNQLMASSLARLNQPNPDTFHADVRFVLDALSALTTRPDQVKQLRQAILNLAVRGKLVPQDPNDEPSSELLKQIAAANTRSPNSRSSRRKETFEDHGIVQAPFELPVGWAWGRFPQLGMFGRGKSKHRPRNDGALFENGTHPLIQTGDVARSGGTIVTHSSAYNNFGLSQSLRWPKGTLCITIAANIADSGILTFDACFPDSVVGFIPAPIFESARYFEYFIRTAKADLLEFAPATAQKNINLETLSSVVIPLPPLAEQRRIVAKVDKLMALCDKLEAGLIETDSTRRQLLDALLAEALAPTETFQSQRSEPLGVMKFS